MNLVSDIVPNICRNLDVFDVVSCSGVCKPWNSLIANREIWAVLTRKLGIHCDDISNAKQAVANHLKMSGLGCHGHDIKKNWSIFLSRKIRVLPYISWDSIAQKIRFHKESMNDKYIFTTIAPENRFFIVSSNQNKDKTKIFFDFFGDQFLKAKKQKGMNKKINKYPVHVNFKMILSKDPTSIDPNFLYYFSLILPILTKSRRLCTFTTRPDLPIVTQSRDLPVLETGSYMLITTTSPQMKEDYTFPTLSQFMESELNETENEINNDKSNT